VLLLLLSGLAYGDADDLIKYSFSRELAAGVDLNQIKESHLVATDTMGHIESHKVHLSHKDGIIAVEADFESKKGLTNAIAWLVSVSGEEWSVSGPLAVENTGHPAETQATPIETATPVPSVRAKDPSECTTLSYHAFLLAHEVENIKASLVALSIEDPLQAALQAREAELSELLRGIAENESPKPGVSEELSQTSPAVQAHESGGQGAEIPLGVQKKELEKLRQDREALEDELAAWGVM